MKRSHALVSIAMCTYNGERFIREQIESLVHQSYRPLELVIVDDQSQDGTFSILEEYAKSGIDGISFLLYKNDIRLGYVKNFERAISLCHGSFIALADQDDIWDLRKIELLIQNIGRHTLVYHDSLLIDEAGNSLNRRMSDRFRMFSGSYPKRLLLFNCVSGHSLMFRKDLVSAFGCFSERHYYDQWIAYVASNVGSIGYVEKCLVKYRQHATSVIALDSRSSIYQSPKRRGYYKIIEMRSNVLSNIAWLEKCRGLACNKNPYFTRWLLFCMITRKYAIWSVLAFSTILLNRKTLFYARIAKEEYLQQTDTQYIKNWYLWGLRGIILRYFWRR